jgi:hypothetical protein
MQLKPGDKLGPYEIQGHLEAGQSCFKSLYICLGSAEPSRILLLAGLSFSD